MMSVISAIQNTVPITHFNRGLAIAVERMANSDASKFIPEEVYVVAHSYRNKHNL